ncbi:hypothetical protein V6N13_073106 [Hibiscus sabdariffa]
MEEPQSFEKAMFLIETNKLERIDEMVEVLTSNGSVIQVQVQEVEVVHSHDIICPCDRESEDGESEDIVGVEYEGETTWGAEFELEIMGDWTHGGAGSFVLGARVTRHDGGAGGGRIRGKGCCPSASNRMGFFCCLAKLGS